MRKVLLGVDHLLSQEKKFPHARIALVTNNAATTSDAESVRSALLIKGFTITKLFSPEHGLTAMGEDGAYQTNRVDPLTQLPVISLYGDHLMPTAADMDDVDLLLFDIPDVGCRFYTYLWTMSYVMEACAVYHKPLVILDRPNPISGNIEKAEGPMLDEIHGSSFIGRWSIPVRHSCTLGELAAYFLATRKMDMDLTVIPLSGWNRNGSAAANEYPFTPTSPAIATLKTAFCYPGTGLLEGIHVNEGRGTVHPFTVFGAPWINAALLQENMQQLHLPGILFSEIQYTPSASLYAGECCNGLLLSITDEHLFLPVQTGITIIQQLLSLFPEYCYERLYKTVANPSGEKHLDKLLGVVDSFQTLKTGTKISTELHQAWEQQISPFLLYH